MLKVSIKEDATLISLEVEGRLAGPWVAELEQCWLREDARAHDKQNDKQLSVRLSAVTFIDDSGKQLLARMVDHGTRIQGSGCMIRAIVEGIIARCKALTRSRSKGATEGAAAESVRTKQK
jgi:anti-anti-sigma regulatory factor